MSDGLDAHVEVALGELHLRADLVVARGETVALVGPNGAGKTTLLRALAGLQPLDAGRITLDGDVVDDVALGVHVPVEERSVGVVFQDYLLFPHLSVVDNVAFGLRRRQVRRSAARARAGGWLAQVGLEAAAGLRPSALSGGQAQRVALARALAIEPAMLLLDEPLAALDATTRVEVRRELRRHLRAHDGVRIVVTHDPVDAAALADRLVVLDAGAVVQEGTLAEIAERPRSRYVADLVGVNLLAGTAVAGRIDVGGLTLVVADHVDGDVLLTIPPRAVTLARTRPQGTPRNVWAGVIDHVEQVGDRVRVRVGGPVTIVAEVTRAAADELALVEGTDAWVSVKATEIESSPA